MYLPRYRITTEEIARAWKRDPKSALQSLGVHEKTAPGPHEDSFTMAFEAGKQAIDIAGLQSSELSALFVGSESHPYAVKPTSGMLASALAIHPFSHCADLEFACKAGTAGMQIVDSFVRSGQIQYGMAIGTDTAQAKPGDPLEYTAAAGAAALILGNEKTKKAFCRIDETLSFTTDTPDFWRANGEPFPSHAGRFTGEPGYFAHVRETLKGILTLKKISPADIDHLILHMPNAKFPQKIAKEFGFTSKQLQEGFIVPTMGNTYSACALIGLIHVLQKAKKGETILLVSYGSGAGSDAFLMTMLRDGLPLPSPLQTPQYLSYSEYRRQTTISP